MADRERGRVEAVVFDMDGLLVNTELLSHRAWLAFLEREFGIAADPSDYRWITAMVGRTGLEVWTSLRDYFDLPVEFPRDLPHCDRAMREIYEEILARDLEPLPGAIALVRACRAAGWRLGIASSSRMAQIEYITERLGLRACFDALTSGKEVPRSKPDPAIYRLACERLGVEPAVAVAIEDSGPGVMAARDAGLRVLAVPSDYTATHDFTLASAIVPSLAGVTPADLLALPAGRLGNTKN